MSHWRLNTVLNHAPFPRRVRYGQKRHYDHNVHTHKRFVEKLRYIHATRSRADWVEKWEDWKWSSFLHCATCAEGVVEIEPQWTERKADLPILRQLRAKG